MKRSVLGLTMLLALAAPRFAAADDPFDLFFGQPGFDDDSFSENELVNGSVQIHDLQNHTGNVIDEDWFRFSLGPYSSYELIVDGMSPHISGLTLEVVTSGGTVVQGATSISGIGLAQSLRLRNQFSTPTEAEYIRITNASCSSACQASDQYRVQFYETTGRIPRFNNSATQLTLVILQNGSVDNVLGAVRYWNPAGTLLGFEVFDLQPKGSIVMNSTGVPGVAGQSGNITIDYDGVYGALTGKAVSLEPATGFTFDTAMSLTPH